MKTAQTIYRIVNADGKDDVDMTRREALRIYHQLRMQLFPPALRPAPKRSTKQKRPSR